MEIGRLGGLAVLNLEGLWTRYEDPTPQLEEIASLPAEKATRRMQEIYQEPLKPELIDPNELCQRVIAMGRNTLPEALAVAFAPGAEVPRIYADPLQIEQVLLNLLLNARDAVTQRKRVGVPLIRITSRRSSAKTRCCRTGTASR